MTKRMTKRWFLPQTADLLGMLQQQMVVTCDGMDAFVRWAEGDAAAEHDVREAEHRADASKRGLWTAVRDAFTTPIDAEDLFTLSALLDGVLNGAKDIVRESDVLALAPDAATAQMARMLKTGVAHLADAFEQLAARDERATDAADAAVKSARGLEHEYRRAMSALLGNHDIQEVMSRREIYRRLVSVADALVGTADRVWYAVVKEA